MFCQLLWDVYPARKRVPYVDVRIIVFQNRRCSRMNIDRNLRVTATTEELCPGIVNLQKLETLHIKPWRYPRIRVESFPNPVLTPDCREISKVVMSPDKSVRHSLSWTFQVTIYIHFRRTPHSTHSGTTWHCIVEIMLVDMLLSQTHYKILCTN